jgi:hypothetical protein
MRGEKDTDEISEGYIVSEKNVLFMFRKILTLINIK